MNKEKSLSIQIPGQEGGPGTGEQLLSALTSLIVFSALAEAIFECFRLWEMGESRIFLFIPGIVLICGTLGAGLALRREGERIKIILPMVIAAILVVLIIVFRTDISLGVRSYAEQLMGLRTEYTGRIQMHFLSEEEGDGAIKGIHLVSGLLSLLLAVLASFSARTSGPVPAILISVFFIAVILIGVAVPAPGLVLAAGAPVLGALMRSGFRSTALAGGIVALAAVIAVVTGISGGLDTPSIMDYAKDVYHEARYEKRGNPMPEGKLLKAEAFEPSGRTALLITMSEPEGTYLRGFVGVNFDGCTWSGLKGSEAREQADPFYWLHESGFYGQTQEALAYDSVPGTDPDGMGTMTVVNMSACERYVYVPYGMSLGESFPMDKKDIGDTRILNTGNIGGPYTFSYRTAAVRNSYKLQQALADADPDYAEAESAYRETVYSSYMDIPESVEKTLSSELGPREDLSTTEAKIRAMEYLDGRVSYEAETVIKDTDDVITAFLTEEEEGQSIHYASAAAMILRYFGVPARYAEGFIVPGELADSVLPGEPIEVSEGYAHAWCEYYLDGVGWIPFESTPGYRNSNMYAGTDNMEAISDEEGGKAGYAKKKEKDEKSTDSEIDNPANRRRKVFVFRKVWIVILVMAALAVFSLITLIRRFRLSRFKKTFRKSDAGTGANNAFAYAVMLLSGRIKGMSTSRLAEAEGEVRDIFDLGDEFRDALRLSEKSLFSSHSVTEEERERVVSFAEKVLERYRSSRNAAGRLADRLIRCIY